MKRFYSNVSVSEAAGGWQVMLDHRVLKTQGGKPQIVPREALAQMLAKEWDDQPEKIDPTLFKARDLADYALDVVTDDPASVADKLVNYADTDTLCYRADPDEPLFARQQEVWEPLLQAFEAREDVQMQRISGVIHRPQNDETLDKLRGRLATLDPFALAALEVMTSLSASLCIGLSALDADADGEALWDAANLEEDWQTELWGCDAEAEARRAKRKGDFLFALKFAGAAKS